MKATVFPSTVIDNKIKIPPSKSLAHRAIICACLADGVSVIDNVDFSEDIKATIAGMRKFGAKIDINNDVLTISGNKLELLQDNIIDANESGSTLRFFIPIFSLFDQEIKFVGSKRLLERPLDVYEEIYLRQGLVFNKSEDCLITNGKLKADNYTVKGNISSQFISGLLFVLPLLENDSKILITDVFESKSYVKLTVDILRKFNIEVTLNEDNTIDIKGNQHYCATNYTVEGDFSQLAFYAVLGCINNGVTAIGMNTKSLQGDREVINIIKSMNAKVTTNFDGYKFEESNLIGTTIDLKNCPDLGPVLMVLASLAKGSTKIINAGRLRIKESDRIEAMETELRKLNVDISSDNDTITINPGSIKVLDSNISGHNDHRIVMAMSVLATIADKALVISDAEAINKSYPGFFRDLASIKVRVEDYEQNK
jgi:3-phosphoshikimate 1-carboxyvinyltransferase